MARTKATNTPAAIRIENVGPITDLEIPLPIEGGVVCLLGKNGSGKSSALNAVEALTGREAKLTARDGQKSAGSIIGPGATIKVASRLTRTGKLDVESIESRLDLSKLVDPPVLDPEAADRVRIKTLVALAGIEPTVDQFREVLGHHVESIQATTWARRDLLDVAGQAKRDLESAARQKESERDQHAGAAQAHRQVYHGQDLTLPDNERELAKALREAQDASAAIAQRQRSAAEAEAAQQNATNRMNRIKSDYAGITAETALANLQSQEGNVANMRARFLKAENELVDLREALHLAAQAEASAQQAYLAAKSHDDTVAALSA